MPKESSELRTSPSWFLVANVLIIALDAHFSVMSLIRIFKLFILYLKCFSARPLLEKGGSPLERPVLAELRVF